MNGKDAYTLDHIMIDNKNKKICYDSEEWPQRGDDETTKETKGQTNWKDK